MRLLETQTLRFREFAGDCPVPYAILSHTWVEGEEVTYQDLTKEYNNRHSQPYKAKKGWKKILNCGRQAQEDDLDYIWVDTCCINKESSAELSEAINSMFRWYAKADTCYAYITGAGFDTDTWESQGKPRWFSRGWTLQELLAPITVDFFVDAPREHLAHDNPAARDDVSPPENDSNPNPVPFEDEAVEVSAAESSPYQEFDESDMGQWYAVGDRTSLAPLISRLTGIGEGFLTGNASIWSTSIAQRMSWAAPRETGREEDRAYCLLGLFNISMPLIYGEGHKAFQRLQQEIMKVSSDTSILAWDNNVDAKSEMYFEPLRSTFLADSPRQFLGCQNIVTVRPRYMASQTSFAVSQHGLEMTVPVYRSRNTPFSYAILDCGTNDRHGRGRFLLALRLMDWDRTQIQDEAFNNFSRMQFVRMPRHAVVKLSTTDNMGWKAQPRDICIRQETAMQVDPGNLSIDLDLYEATKPRRAARLHEVNDSPSHSRVGSEVNSKRRGRERLEVSATRKRSASDLPLSYLADLWEEFMDEIWRPEGDMVPREPSK